jgi:hypothetical protein
LNTRIIGVHLIEIDLFGGRIDIIADIVQRTRQVMNILPVEWSNEIPAQLRKYPMREFIIDMLLLSNCRINAARLS